MRIERLTWLSCALLLAVGCYGTHGPGSEGTPPGSGPVDDPPPSVGPTPSPTPAPAPAPGPPPEGIPPLTRGMLDETCGLRGGTSRFVLVPDTGAGFSPLCELEHETYLSIETRLLPENDGVLRIGEAPATRARLCTPEGCVEAEDGTFELFIARGEVATVSYDVRFEDGTAMDGWAEIVNFCGEWCERPPYALGHALLSCGPDDGLAVTLVLHDEAPPACGAPLVDGTSITLLADPASIGWADYFRIPEQATAFTCRDGRCTEALEGVVRISTFEWDRYIDGEYVFFASPGTDYAGRFSVSDYCESLAFCG